MGSKMAATSLHWSQPSFPHSPSSSRTVASSVSSPSSKRRRFVAGDGISCANGSILGVKQVSKLQRSSSRNIRRALSASLDSFSDEEFKKKIQELAFRFQLSDDGEEHTDRRLETADADAENPMPFDPLQTPPSSFHDRDEIIPANIEWKANRVDIPLSLRIIKRKKQQWQEGFAEAGESTYCSVKKAFSSMVFIIRELYSFTLQMREALLYEDLRGIFDRVQKEMHASFVWLFQKVFSHTPMLMVHVMILLANYSVYSMSTNAAIAVAPEEEVCNCNCVVEDQRSIIRTLNLSSSSGKAASIGGNVGGGGGKYRPVSSGTDGGDDNGNGSMDQETIQISAVDADDHSDQLRTEMQYQIQLAEDPNNPLLLANYAQFLYLVAKDYDRAEHHFKQAANAEPKDGEALNKYANFLWVVRNDLWAAEETYLEAISTEPSNVYYAASYAHFLWNTGGEDTCFLLDDEAVEKDI